MHTPGMDKDEWSTLNRQLMAEWRRLLDHSPAMGNAASQHMQLLSNDIITRFDSSKGCTELSTNWQRVTGHAVKSSLGDGFYQYLAYHHVKPFCAALMELFAGCAPHQSEFLLNQHGEERWVRLRAAPVEPLSGGQQRVTLLLSDAHEAITAREAAAKAEATRTAFLNTISHELRTPLNAILGFTQMMEGGLHGEVTAPRHREYLRHMRESGYDLLAQIDELVELACIESGTATLYNETLDFAEILDHVCALHQPQAARSCVTLHRNIAPQEVLLQVDRMKLQHIISHLLANALRHSRTGGQISVDAYLTLHNEMCITVTDEGMGMSARKLQQVVEALHQPGNWAQRAKLGLGLGLPLAQEFARLHGGYVTLESKAGAGTRVALCLPASCIAATQNLLTAHSALA